MTRTRTVLPHVESRLTGTVHPRNQLKRRLKSELAALPVQAGEALRPSLWLSVTASPFVLHVAVRDDASLADVDAFLRRVWMECCGHLSQFIYRPKDGQRVLYLAEPEDSDDDIQRSFFPDMSDDEWAESQAWMALRFPVEKPLSIKVSEAFENIPSLIYEYDMGTTTSCTLKVEAQLTLPWPEKKTVRLLARNVRPDWVCRECGKAGTALCVMGDCWDGGFATFCATHARSHPRKVHPAEGGDAWMMAALSNSPRDPSCGYQERPDDEKVYRW